MQAGGLCELREDWIYTMQQPAGGDLTGLQRCFKQSHLWSSCRQEIGGIDSECGMVGGDQRGRVGYRLGSTQMSCQSGGEIGFHRFFTSKHSLAWVPIWDRSSFR